jgi:hypothetical protein
MFLQQFLLLYFAKGIQIKCSITAIKFKRQRSSGRYFLFMFEKLMDPQNRMEEISHVGDHYYSIFR